MGEGQHHRNTTTGEQEKLQEGKKAARPGTVLPTLSALGLGLSQDKEINTKTANDKASGGHLRQNFLGP